MTTTKLITEAFRQNRRHLAEKRVVGTLDNPPIGVWGQPEEGRGGRRPDRRPGRRQQVAWTKGMPCWIQAHFGLDLDELDEQDELDRSHGELSDGSYDSAGDGAEPHSMNYECNGSGRAVVGSGEIDPFPRSFCFSSWFEFASIIVDTDSARECPRHH
jgi:hypothetical protein